MQTANETLSYPQTPDSLAQEILLSLADGESDVCIAQRCEERGPPQLISQGTAGELYTEGEKAGLRGGGEKGPEVKTGDIFAFLHILLLFQPCTFHYQLIGKVFSTQTFFGLQNQFT